MKKSKFLILGGGMVAGYASKELAERGLKPGELTIVSGDTSLPYERPPLSKSFLAGKDTEDSIRINTADFYREHGIEIVLECRIRALDAARKIVYTDSNQEYAFDNLLIATGAHPRKLDVPGADLPGVHYLRSLDDSKRIRAHAESAKRAAIIGGGFIAMEAASVLAQKGIETTMVLREDRVWRRFFTPAMSRFFENYYAEREVKFIKQAKVAEIQSTRVRLDGDRTVDCDITVAGIGVSPTVEFLEGSGLKISDGIVVDEYLRTNIPAIHAAGDVAHYYDALFAKPRRVEHWDNAVSQGQYCARALTGDKSRFEHVPYFFSDIFDLSYEFWGDTANADQTVERGDISSRSFSVWWLAKDRVIAAFAMNRPDEEREVAPQWIASGASISAGNLKSAAALKDLMPAK